MQTIARAKGDLWRLDAKNAPAFPIIDTFYHYRFMIAMPRNGAGSTTGSHTHTPCTERDAIDRSGEKPMCSVRCCAVGGEPSYPMARMVDKGPDGDGGAVWYHPACHASSRSIRSVSSLRETLHSQGSQNATEQAYIVCATSIGGEHQYK